MAATRNTLRIFDFPEIDAEINTFLLDRQARGLSPRTIDFCCDKLGMLERYLAENGIKDVQSITTPLLRAFFVKLAEIHSPGGCHGVYRSVKVFLRWWEAEAEPEGWTNPINRVRAPKLPKTLLEPVAMETVKAMLATCRGKRFYDVRDKAILLCLLDTGCRAMEFVNLNSGDLDLKTGRWRIVPHNLKAAYRPSKRQTAKVPQTLFVRKETVASSNGLSCLLPVPSICGIIRVSATT